MMDTPIDQARRIELDERDWRSWRDRLLIAEERIAHLERMHIEAQRQNILFMQGTKERFNALSLLLDRTSPAVDRKDVE